MARVLVAEDSRTQAEQIRILLEEVGHEVVLAADGQTALEALRKSGADIVLTDLEMPRLNGLELVDAVRRERPALPVVLMTAHGSEEIAALALSRGAASYIPKAYLEQDAVATLERLLGLTGRQHVQAIAQLERFDLNFTLDNDAASIAPVVGYVDEILEHLHFSDATDRMRIGVALQEACLNAIYHGNLEVSSDFRQQDESVYHALVRSRRQTSPYRERRVHFGVVITPTHAIFTMRDEGPGFDRSGLPAVTADNLERIGGRGLILIHTFMDAVTYNERGNVITMIKRRTRT